MRFIGRMTIVLGSAAILAANAGADEGSDSTGKIVITGGVELETAEMMRARITYSAVNQPIDHVWYSHMLGNLGFRAAFSNTLRMRAGFEFRSYMNMSPTIFDWQLNTNAYNLGDLAYSEFFLREAQGIFSLLNTGETSIELAFGYMPYKYNPEVRSLGEFLFRSGTYPFYLLGEFDRPFARLAGLRASVKTGGERFNWNFDWLVMTERQYRPFWDISIAAVASAQVMKTVEVSAGVDFAHALPVNNDITTPTGYPRSQYVYNQDTTRIESGWYTFSGTKLMARGTIDLVELIGWGIGAFGGGSESVVRDLREVFGERGGKIYGEAAIIGLESYPANAAIDTSATEGNPYGYDKLRDKMPWMAGITIPTWIILDECAFEIERYPNPTPNSTAYLLINGLPLPYFKRVPSSTTYGFGVYQPRWHWSLYMKKQFMKKWGVIFQIGREHVQWELPMIYQTANYDYEDCMVRSDEWGWHLKAVFGF